MRDEDLREDFASWLQPIREAVPPGMPLIERRLRRRRTRNVAAAAAAIAALAGTVLALHLPAATTHRGATAGPSPALGASKSSTSATVPSGIRTLVVTAGAGKVRITGGQRSTVSVTDTVRYSATPPTATRTVNGTTLTLSASCQVRPRCVVDYDIQVPRGIAVHVTLGTGDITLTGLAGPVTATTGTGRISAVDLSSGTVSLRTGIGEIDAGFASPPDTLLASAQDGEINIGVPGTDSYQVNAQANETVINVDVSTSSRHVITASTGIGAITVVPGAPATSPSAAMHTGTVTQVSIPAMSAFPSGFPFAP